MRRLACGVVLGLLSLAGCTPGTLGSPGTGGTTGTGDTGGTSATGGTPGTGGATAGTGGGGLPGTVTLQIVLPPGQSFCDENPSCQTTQHLWLLTAAGQELALYAVGCIPSCSTCAPIPCPDIPVIACPAGNFGVSVTNSSFTWDGSYTESGSCEPTNTNTSVGAVALSCADTKVAAAGSYLARFCATPGTLSAPDGGVQVCTPTGAQECVETRFDFPSTQPVLITLPTD
jgi:hypothetical protein